MSVVGPIAEDRESVNAVLEELAGRMILKRWLDAAGRETWGTVCGGTLIESPVFSSGCGRAASAVVGYRSTDKDVVLSDLELRLDVNF
ncbi:jg20797 [Pararge aegeria aegeria]|uniref:Jg20797 protein n=1 Tax=Pararge aegeria aegeria TaxID=348720 RepID=A0A8S4RBJ6_9NEOP|nr:jg20797 [Pararge aegeria aegeria]